MHMLFRRRSTILALAVINLAVLIPVFRQSEPGFELGVRVFTAVLCVLLATTLVLILAVCAAALSAALLPHRVVPGGHNVEITAEGLITENSEHRTVTRWHGIQRFRRTSQWALLQVSEAHVVYVPLRPGRTEGDALACVQEIQRLRSTALSSG